MADAKLMQILDSVESTPSQLLEDFVHSHREGDCRFIVKRIKQRIDRNPPNKLGLYYSLDSLIKKKWPRFNRAVEELILPHYELELKKHLSNNELLIQYLVLFFAWDGILDYKALSDCMTRFHSVKDTERVRPSDLGSRGDARTKNHRRAPEVLQQESR